MLQSTGNLQKAILIKIVNVEKFGKSWKSSSLFLNLIKILESMHLPFPSPQPSVAGCARWDGQTAECSKRACVRHQWDSVMMLHYLNLSQTKWLTQHLQMWNCCNVTVCLHLDSQVCLGNGSLAVGVFAHKAAAVFLILTHRIRLPEATFECQIFGKCREIFPPAEEC